MPLCPAAAAEFYYPLFKEWVVKTTGHASQCGGSRERKGFMVKVWWAGLEQREHELVEQLPGYKMACFRQLSDEI